MRKLKVKFFRLDGTPVPVDENGKYDPPLKLPDDIHREILIMLNAEKGINVK